jgi:transposase InsO family protein
VETRRSEEIAANRLKLVTPLLDQTLDHGKRQQLKEEICINTGLSERTLRRYVKKYEQNGFEGLKPKRSGHSGRSVIPEEVIAEAIALRREVPKRSITNIIRILEWEKVVAPGVLKRSTLQDQLTYRGYSSRQMRTYASSVTSARRFQKPWRNYLWQSDIKNGIYIDGKPTYMVCFLDDCHRYILHSEFYPALDQRIVQDCFRKALMKYGAPDSVLFDNGPQYRTRWMQRVCGKLGIRLLYSKPYNPQGKGKQEKYNGYVDGFLREALIEKPKTIDGLNRLYQVWMDECYQHRGHSALKGSTPHESYNSDSRELNMLSLEMIGEAFLSCEKRKVDKSGCISFMGQRYEVEMGLHMIHKNVDVIYDPGDITKVTIECAGVGSCSAIPLVIQSHVGAKPRLPEQLSVTPPNKSRLLNAAKTVNETRQKVRKTAISFKTITGKEGV